MNNIVYNCDCMELMRTLPNKVFDLAIVDPPYGIGVGTMTYTNDGAIRTHGYAVAKRRDYRGKAKWDNERPDPEYFSQLLRISQKQIIWGGNYFSDILPPSRSFIVWDKRCNDEMSNDFSDCEYAWSSCGGVARVFRFVWNGMIQGDMKRKEDRFHPTQKPVALYKWLLQRYAKPCDRIFDSHVGSGSIRIACHDMGFDFTGCEIDQNYWQAQEQRFQAHVQQMDLFGAEEIQKGIYEGAMV